jgi:23S rRNA-/tRNA-specific pseudouridylate synthase
VLQHPIIGDAKYQLPGGVSLAGPLLMLCAVELSFPHPTVTGKTVHCEIEELPAMQQFWQQQQTYWAQRN